MTCAPLALIQCRLGSTRLPNKMLCEVGGFTLIERAFWASCEAFGRENVIAAIPDNDAQALLVAELNRIGCRIFAWAGDEHDVLSRLWYAAHQFRWHPASVLVRVTADDFRKSPELMKRVARGERHPVELGCEAFTLAMLDAAHASIARDNAPFREHLTWALFQTSPPKAPEGSIWTIDTPADLAAARAQSTDPALNPWSGERCIP